MRVLSNSIEETNNVAKEYLKTIRNGNTATVIGLRGNLGSGKTTFVKAIAEALDVKATVTSPTFVIEKIYKLEDKTFNHLIHIDAYRLENGEELLNLGFKEILSDSNNLVLIEWPENVYKILPENVSYIDFKFIDDNSREINYEE